MTRRLILGVFTFTLFGLLAGLFVYMAGEVDVIAKYVERLLDARDS